MKRNLVIWIWLAVLFVLFAILNLATRQNAPKNGCGCSAFPPVQVEQK